MARFETVEDLVAAAPSLLASGIDAVAYLARPDVLGDALRARLAAARPAAMQLDGDTRRRLAARLGGGDRVVLAVGEAVDRMAPPHGDDDLAIAFALPLLDEVLAGAWQTHAMPHELVVDGAPVVLAGPLRLEAVEGGGAVAVIPLAGGALRVPVGFEAVAGTDERIRIVLDFTVADADSATAGLRAALDQSLGHVLGPTIADSSICPPIAVPGIDHATLRLQRTRFRTFPGADGRGVLAIGLTIGEETLPPASRAPLAGDPLAALGGANAWVHAHGSLADKLLRAAWRTGSLERALDHELARTLPGVSAEVHATHATFVDGAIRARAELTLRGFGGGPIRFGLAAEVRLAITEGVVRAERTTVVEGAGEPALLWSLLDGLLFAVPCLGRALVDPLTVATGDDPPPLVASSHLASALPVPGSELVPSVHVSHAAIGDAVVSAGTLVLEPDTTNLHVYARFTDGDVPLPGATVLLRDLDRPAPPGDDVVPPEDYVHELVTAKTFTTVRRQYRTSPDQTLKHGTTSATGRVRFVLSPPEQHTIAGTVETTTVTEYLDGDRPPETTIQRQAIMERYPDLYFVVRRLDGSVVSTSARPIINARRGEAGTAALPLGYDLAALDRPAG